MNTQFYQVGGSLPANAKSYIKREADDKLYAYLKEGKYAYVLNARQVGKSSLRVHTSKRLEEEGYSCVNIDLTSIGSEDITADEWYFSFVYQIIEQLGLEEEAFIEWWDSNSKLTIVNRFSKVFDKFILEKSQKNIIIMIDEVDSILGIKKDFSANDFFAVIRTFYNLRSEDERYSRVTFALFGVATPEDLMRDSSRTPFNIAHSVKIEQFKLEESLFLLDGLESQQVDSRVILEKIFEWTSGTPYLTQKILDYIVHHPIERVEDIDRVVDVLFIQENFKEINISNIQNRILSNEKYNLKMLYLIGEIMIEGSKKIEDANLEQIYLNLSGVVKKIDGHLIYTNKIYQTIFNQTWLNEVLGKIDRPFSQDLQRWGELNKKNTLLLKDEILEKANKWALERDDLTSEESEYLRLSNQYNQEKILKKERRKFLTLLFSIFIIIVLIPSYWSYTKKKESNYQEYFNQGEKFLSYGDNDKAITLYKKAIEVDSKNDKAYFRLAKAYSKNRNYEKSIEFLNKAINLSAEYSNLSSNVSEGNRIGVIYNDLEYYDEALLHFHKVMEEGKADYFTYYNLGNTYYRKAKHDKSIKNYEKAIENYKRATDLNASYDKAYNDWAFTLFVQQKYQEAIKIYNEAIRINPNNYKSLNSMGYVYWQLHKNQEAVKYFKRAIDANNKHDRAYINLFRIQLLDDQPFTLTKQYEEVFKGKKEKLINYEILAILKKISNGEQLDFVDEWRDKYKETQLAWQPFGKLKDWAQKNENEEIRKRLLDAIEYFKFYRDGKIQ